MTFRPALRLARRFAVLALMAAATLPALAQTPTAPSTPPPPPPSAPPAPPPPPSAPEAPAPPPLVVPPVHIPAARLPPPDGEPPIPPLRGIDTVQFQSLDGVTPLIGYVFSPATQGPFSALVMMHGRGGVYAGNAHGRYDASTLSRRLTSWGQFWASQGYVALLVDSYSGRGHPGGLRRPKPGGSLEIDDVSVRPLDALAALRWLRQQPAIRGDRIGIMGWAGGGTAALAAIGAEGVVRQRSQPGESFRAVVAMYPDCLGLRLNGKDYDPNAPLKIYLAGSDDEVSPLACKALVSDLVDTGHDAEQFPFRNATHDFDDPSDKSQALQANHEATEDVLKRAAKFLDAYLAH
jgi:carboxymethylenebutenolidase